MNVLKSIAIAFSMYSRIPMPVFEWKKENMKYSICFFPFVGLVISFIISLLYYLFGAYFAMIPDVAKTLFILAIPVVISGGIHLDGYMDTSDALSSYRDREKRLEILKDPHIGAFAVIRLLLYSCIFLATVLTIVSAHAELDIFFSWSLVFFLSRILSGIAVVSFKCAKSNGTLYTFAEGAERTKCKALMTIEVIICIFLMTYFGKVAGVLGTVASFLVFIYYHRMANDKFGGLTGDLAGFFVCVCELVSSFAFMIWLFM
ncbi:cobalamin-5'-phosphate synthase [Butyrivibrio proteoclasticus]|uniref:Adenosylcobinamide-GDP ribazoletransferase n=1 Tax=Butyrivibrio proteoclasticus TaxID=43305 RepID=A0A1I5QDC8_9FIRM|nr:adenosylcobinamide-GDP ribazoletransferase [Butyrivibrio proteoclasticus]SFP44265.1 cobalamin-5'-phosphate synthase [Butyrivibrio proteoclasticus]